MSAAASALDDWIKRLRSLGRVPEFVAPQVAQALELELRAQIVRGEGPDGVSWPLTEDGKTALRRAGKALSVRAVGATVVARLDGPEARHNEGKVRGGVKRQILPSKDLSARASAAVKKVVDAELARRMAGGT